MVLSPATHTLVVQPVQGQDGCTEYVNAPQAYAQLLEIIIILCSNNINRNNQ